MEGAQEESIDQLGNFGWRMTPRWIALGAFSFWPGNMKEVNGISFGRVMLSLVTGRKPLFGSSLGVHNSLGQWLGGGRLALFSPAVSSARVHEPSYDLGPIYAQRASFTTAARQPRRYIRSRLTDNEASYKRNTS